MIFTIRRKQMDLSIVNTPPTTNDPCLQEGCRLRHDSSATHTSSKTLIQLTHLSVLDDGPLEPLNVETDSSERREEDDGLETNLLPVVVLRLGGPVEERSDVLGHLGGGSGCAWRYNEYTCNLHGKLRHTIVVLNKTVVQNSGHCDGTTGEEGVVVQALGDVDSGRGVDVTS